MKKKNYSFRQRVQYSFDNFMSRGSIGLILALGIASSMVVILAAVLVSVSGTAPEADGVKPGFPGLIWLGLMHIIDQGTITGSSGSIFYLAIMLAVTAAGLLVLSVLISIITTALSDKLEELRDGRSGVIEEDHVVILGWSQQVLATVSELVEGHSSRKPLCIVIMGNENKAEMHQQIMMRLRAWSRNSEPEMANRIRKIRKTRIICRRGDPSDLNDILIPDIKNSRSVIIHNPESENSDIEVIKTLMAIRKIYFSNDNPDDSDKLDNHANKSSPILIAELQEPKNRSLVDILEEKIREKGLSGWVIHRNDVISKIITQTCRQKGLSDVLQEIISFEGNEIYFHKPDSLFIGKQYGEIRQAYENAVVLGLWDRNTKRHTINPPPEAVVTSESELILLCEDDPSHSPLFMKKGRQDMEVYTLPESFEKKPEHTLVLGWSILAENILLQLDEYVFTGSTALIAVDESIVNLSDIQSAIDRLSGKMKNLALSCTSADGTDHLQLQKLDPLGYNRVLALAYTGLPDIQRTDAVTLITLMHLRDMEKKAYNKNTPNEESNFDYSVVAEMLDNRNRDLAEKAGYSDFIVSDRLLSLMVAQYSGDSRRADVFHELFSSDGCEIYLKPLDYYHAENISEAAFSALASAAELNSETALGCLLFDEREKGLTGVHLNPSKSEIIRFSGKGNDRLIVIARAV